MAKVKEKVHKCEKCKAVFTQRSNLCRHRGNCLGVKKFSCIKCSKSFTRKDSLQNHIKICSGVKELSCQLCSSEFPTTWKLKRHIKQVHDKVTFNCINCGRKFNQENYLTSHQMKCNAMKNKANKRANKKKIPATGGFEPHNYFESPFEDGEEVRT